MFGEGSLKTPSTFREDRVYTIQPCHGKSLGLAMELGYSFSIAFTVHYLCGYFSLEGRRFSITNWVLRYSEMPNIGKIMILFILCMDVKQHYSPSGVPHSKDENIIFSPNMMTYYKLIW